MIELVLVALAVLAAAFDVNNQPSNIEALQVSELTAIEREAVVAWDKSHRDDTAPLEFTGAAVDLNSDGAKEIVAYMEGRYYCGMGGCNLIVLTPDKGKYRLVGNSTINWLPTYVLPNKHNDWLDLAVTVHGGGYVNAFVARLPFDGKRYARNPSVAPASATKAIDAKILIAVPK